MELSGNEDSESEIPQTIELNDKPGPSRQETSESEIGQAWEKAGRRKKRKNKKAANKINNDKETGKGEQSVRENPKERRASKALRDKESRESSEEREPGNDIEQERHNAKMNVEDMDPEEREVERLMENYKIVMSLVPNNSSTITVDDRRQIRAAMHEIKIRTMIMIGVAKELRHAAKASEKKMTTAPTAVNPKRTTPGSYSAAVKTGQTENTGRTEETQKSQRQQHKVSVTAKETGMTPEQVATVLREKIDPTTHKLAVRNFVTTKKGVIECNFPGIGNHRRGQRIRNVKSNRNAKLGKMESNGNEDSESDFRIGANLKMEARNYVAVPKLLVKGPSCSSPTVSASEEDSEHVVLTSVPAPSTNCSSDESCAEAKFTTVRRKSSRKLIKKEVAKARNH
ncbi:hypothetical protein RN001_013702 [Aquatica leii]|uniref:Uncharacterized protein n=1 Tax=Aquatica leii TaxID=1421715 RepID=A0AAN7PS36_9COLE|nr:hypothetical protein RN001_013702 [Aquatica leii]